MKAAIRFVRKWWWLALMLLAIIFSVLWKLLTGKRGSAEPITQGLEPSPTLVEKARDQIEKVHLEGEVEKAKTRTVAEEQIKRIEAIEEKGKTHPKVARKELAEFLAANL